MTASAEYSIEIHNNSSTDFKLDHYGVGGAKAKTHQAPAAVLNAGSVQYLSWNVGNDRYTPSSGHAYWFANPGALFAIQMEGYNNGQYPYMMYQYCPPTASGLPYQWIRPGGNWDETFAFCFTGEGGKHYKLTVKNDPQDPSTRLYTVIMTLEDDNNFWAPEV